MLCSFLLGNNAAKDRRGIGKEATLIRDSVPVVYYSLDPVMVDASGLYEILTVFWPYRPSLAPRGYPLAEREYL